MQPNPVVMRSVERRETKGVVTVESVIGDDSVTYSFEVDEASFAGFERAFYMHPFRRKPSEDDVLLFKGLNTPLGTDQKFLDLQIVNRGSRHHLQIETSDEVFRSFKRVFDDWVARFEANRNR